MQTYFGQELVKITGRWYVEIHKALQKCNNIVLCVDRALSLKGALIPRRMHCLFSAALEVWVQVSVSCKGRQGQTLHILLRPEKELGLQIKLEPSDILYTLWLPVLHKQTMETRPTSIIHPFIDLLNQSLHKIQSFIPLLKSFSVMPAYLNYLGSFKKLLKLGPHPRASDFFIGRINITSLIKHS